MKASDSSAIGRLRELLARATEETVPSVLLITGSSGCGKSYLCDAFARKLDTANCSVFHFDEIGVPSEDEMIRQHGSGEAWQRAKTQDWIDTVSQIRGKAAVILEGQFHPQFALDACRNRGVTDFAFAVATCAQLVWEQRLIGRGQAHLITDEMRNWAAYLPKVTVELGGSVIDTSRSDVELNVDNVARLIIAALELKG